MAATKSKKAEMNGTANRVEEHLEADEKKTGKEKQVQISPPRWESVRLRIVGTAPLVQHRFGPKARQMILDAQEAGSQAKKGKKRDPKDFDALYEDARHRFPDGGDGIHAGGFRKALIDACKLVGFFMSRAKIGLRVRADGYGVDGSPLVRITKGEPRKVIHEVRNATGVIDLRARPMWDVGWEAQLTIEFDGDMFSVTDIVNLLMRVGVQCGIAEGRPNSKDSAGCDWGLFDVLTDEVELTK